MTICKYFLQGTCRFGDNCKFEHQLNNDHNYGNTTSILLHNYAAKPTQATSNVDTTTLVKSVVNDMTSAEKGGQWLLSSYAPFKEKPAFPGFEDHSMEEIRYLFYESMRNGTIEQYKQNLQLMLQQAVMKIKALQNPSPDAVNMLKSIYNTAPSSSVSSNQTPFSVPQSSSIFGGAPPQQKSIFGGAPSQQKSIFGAPTSTPSVFGNSSPSVFGGTNQMQQSVFAGGATNNSIFGGAQNSVFANQQPNQSAQNSVFANQQPNQSKSIFGGPQQGSNFGGNSVFAGTPSPTAFDNQPSFPQPSPFQQQSPFAPPQQNLYQQNQFAAQPNSQFRAPQGGQFPGPNQYPAPQPAILESNKPAFQHSNNIFGNLGAQTANPGIFGASTGVALTKPNEEFYSKIEELTEDEIKWFQSDDLDVHKIPEKPPPYEICFKIQ